MNVILVQIDSLCRHFLPPYGNDWVKAPNLSDFASRGVVFDHHYTGSLPCMPARREIWSGTEEFWWRGWGPLEPWDLPIAHLAGIDGIHSQLVTDHYHFFELGAHSYHHDFEGYRFIRGHEHDNWMTEPIREAPDWAKKMMQIRPADAPIYLRNVQHFSKEEDFFSPRTFTAAAEWLDANAELDRFYLHVDSFDVHEPFHVPEPYRSMYTGADYRKFNPWPLYGRIDAGPSALSPEEVEWVRAQFAGKLTMVDKWLGRLFEVMDRRKLWDRTAVIITTDHGHYLGDHSWMGKPSAPCYHTLCHIPLLVWHPDGLKGGTRVPAITQTVDLYATVLDLLGVSAPQSSNIHSRSFAPVIMGKQAEHRDFACYGYFGQQAAISDGRWTFIRSHSPEAAPLFQHTLDMQVLNRSWGCRTARGRLLGNPAMEASRTVPGIELPVWKVPVRGGGTKLFEDQLFDNQEYPDQSLNQADIHEEQVQRLAERIRKHMLEVGAPEEQFARLSL